MIHIERPNDYLMSVLLWFMNHYDSCIQGVKEYCLQLYRVFTYTMEWIIFIILAKYEDILCERGQPSWLQTPPSVLQSSALSSSYTPERAKVDHSNILCWQPFYVQKPAIMKYTTLKQRSECFLPCRYQGKILNFHKTQVISYPIYSFTVFILNVFISNARGSCLVPVPTHPILPTCSSPEYQISFPK